VVVLHGGPGAPGSAASLARALADEFSVLEPLQRRSGIVPLTVSQHVEDLAAIAPAGSGIVGHSWGAMLGLSFAACFPDRVSCLALVGCGTYDEECRAQFRSRLDALMDAATRSQLKALELRAATEVDPDVRDALVRQRGDLTMALESYELIDSVDDPSDALGYDGGANAETWKDVLRLQYEGLEPQRFSRISCPVLMLHGHIDPHPGAATRDLLRRFIPHLQYVEFEKCGHEPWKEQHARHPFLAVLLKWLENSGRR
jgi:pimeloyl-ACP methyl ester carboxylesterase